MNLLELIVTERNRLVRYGIVTSIFSLFLAIWARDAELNVTTPFSSADVGNITVGHAILIGQPIVCVMFLVLCAQIRRYQYLAARLAHEESRPLQWTYFAGDEQRGIKKFVHMACEFFKWFCMIAVPVVASLFLLFSQFDLEVNNNPFSYRHLISFSFYDERPHHSQLRLMNCEHSSIKNNKDGFDECNKKNTFRGQINERMPKLYQPFNFWGGLLLQILVIGAFIDMYMTYFPSIRKKKVSS